MRAGHFVWKGNGMNDMYGEMPRNAEMKKKKKMKMKMKGFQRISEWRFV